MTVRDAQMTRRSFLKGRLPERDFVAGVAENCLPKSGIDCQACRDSCPTEAIRFRPRLGGPFLPDIDSSRCTGCGACIGVCPVAAIDLREHMRENANV
ncbi:4Fe-4S binding protein [Rhizobium sp. RAF56]|jgi:ferredoxin-type protein NapF|uniref:4Fe-4S binding protein n=1 Tax=Rhizobium sp. RAF56 TaxID=3233062 RepID=UPI003F991045